MARLMGFSLKCVWLWNTCSFIESFQILQRLHWPHSSPLCWHHTSSHTISANSQWNRVKFVWDVKCACRWYKQNTDPILKTLPCSSTTGQISHQNCCWQFSWFNLLIPAAEDVKCSAHLQERALIKTIKTERQWNTQIHEGRKEAKQHVTKIRGRKKRDFKTIL